MADLDHNLSLADALTEPPHDVEEEVKRDFIATLEAEKFDDVVGETVDKTDYVPLLDDEDDAKPGSQEPKSKGHVDGIPVERKCPKVSPKVPLEHQGAPVLTLTLLRQGSLCSEPLISTAKAEPKPCLLLFALCPSACEGSRPCWAALCA